MTNTEKQLASLRNQIHTQELSIRRIKNIALRDKAYDAFKPTKAELYKQIKQLLDQQKIHVLTGVQPSFAYGKVLNIHEMKGIVMERYPLRVGETYDRTEHFRAHEVSGFANRLFGKWTWADYVTDDVEALKTVLYEGYGEFKCLFAGWSDRDGRAILVHRDCPFDTLEDAGIMTSMDNQTQSVKARKYISRCFAAGDMNYVPRWGKRQEDSWIESSSECIIELENGETLVLRYIDLDTLTEEEKATVDGHIALSTRAHRVLGLSNQPTVGDSWRVTALEQWLGKGHTHWADDLGADIVIYGPKKLVGLLNGTFCFMSFGELHAGNPHTDIQAVTNFKLYGLAKELTRKYMRYVYVVAQDEKKLRKSVLMTIKTASDESDLLVEGAEDSWVLRKAVMNDLSLFSFPGLYRRAVRYHLKTVLKCEEFRTPMNVPETNITPAFSVGISRYASMQPKVLLEDGTVDMDRSLIAEGEICIPDLPADIDVIIYRQPNENANAWFKLRNVHIPEYMGIAGKSVCFLGRGVQKVLYRLGGGDMDDALIIIYEPTWVEHFATLYYPETDKLAPVETTYADQEELADAPMEDIDYFRYDSDSAEYQITLATTAGMNIGSAVNANMDDDIKSDAVNKASMMADLKSRGLMDAYTWLENADGSGRMPYMTAFLATNLELIIDAAVKDPALMTSLRIKADEMNPQGDAGNVSGVQGFISAYHDIQMVYPYCMRNRIPKSKRDKGDYVLALSEQCKAQQQIISYRNQLEQMFVQNEVQLVKKYDHGIWQELMPMEPDMRLRAQYLVSGVPNDSLHTGIRGYWRSLWLGNYSKTEEERTNVFAMNCALLDAHLMTVPTEIPMIAVELYRQLYKWDNYSLVKNLETGQFQPFPDALLWTNKLANAFINQLIAVRRTGLWIRVHLYLDKHLLAGVHQIRVDAGVIYNDKNEAIGEVNPRLRPGIWTIEDGLIHVRSSHPSLQPKVDVMSAIQPLSNRK